MGQVSGPRRTLKCTWPIVALVLGWAHAWAYWPTLARLVERWQTDPQASHGFIVVVIALLLLYYRRERFPGRTDRPSWWGAVLLLAAGVGRLLGAYFFFEWFDAISLLPALAGCCLLIGGKSALAWSWPAIAYLVLMIPLPFQIEVALAGPLQGMATSASTYVLQTVGYPAIAEGNVIVVGEMSIGVLEACNGLGMLQAFFALSTAVAIMSRRPLWERLVLFASAVPIGVLVNLIRITCTAIATLQLDDPTVFARFHDVAGWLMMPVALLLLWLEGVCLRHLLIPAPGPAPVPVYLPPQPVGNRLEAGGRRSPEEAKAECLSSLPPASGLQPPAYLKLDD